MNRESRNVKCFAAKVSGLSGKCFESDGSGFVCALACRLSLPLNTAAAGGTNTLRAKAMTINGIEPLGRSVL